MRNTRLFLNELKHVYKQSLIFTAIAMFLFMLSISVWCFSSAMIQGYKTFLNDSNDVIYLSIYGLTDMDEYIQIDACGDYLDANYRGITYYPRLRNGDNLIEGTYGIASFLRDELPYYYKKCEFSGRAWSSSDNILPDGNPPIFLAKSIADELSIQAGEEITFEYSDKTGWTSCAMTVEGIFTEEEGIHDDFVIPLSFILDIRDTLNDDFDVYLELQTPSDILTVYPKLTRMGFRCNSMYISLEEVNLVNSMRYILIGVSVVVLVLTFVVLNNTLTITVNARKKYMARLKLLGASTDRVAALYYWVLLLSFFLAFAFGMLLSQLLVGYFSSVASQVLDYPIIMKLHWLPCLTLFGVSCLLILLRYLFFRKKVKKITPGAFIKEEA